MNSAAAKLSDQSSHSDGKRPPNSQDRISTASLPEMPAPPPAKPALFLPALPNDDIGIMQWGLND